jgi:hypothetical protein
MTEEASDVYASMFFHFSEDVRRLSEKVDEQCKEGQYDNVAWELKNFFMKSAEGVLNAEGSTLSDRQRQAIQELLTNVSAIPASVVMVENIRAEHLRAMSHPCWIPIRKQAQALLRVLESETKRTNGMLWPGGK